MLTITKKLDMSPHGVPQVIRVSQYDSDFTLEFKLFASGGNFAISTGTTAEIRGTKQSGTGYSASATLDTSTKVVTVAGAAQMTAVAGMNIFEIVLKKNNKEISSANFCLLVERAALDADTITDESVLKELNAIIQSADAATQAAEEAEDAADRAEAAAQTFVIDHTPTQGSTNAVSSGGVYDAIDSVKTDIIQTAGVVEEMECGLTDEVKTALLACFTHVAWVGDDGQTYWDALSDALNRSRVISSISAVFTQGSTTIYDTDELYALKQYMTVTATYSDGTTKEVNNYTLSGKLVAGTSTITVAYNKKTTTFNVNVTHQVKTLESISAAFSSSASITTDNVLDDLRPYLTVLATYSDGSTNTITNYTLSGSLNVGANTITVTYNNKTTTFTVTVTEAEKTLQSITAVFNQGSTVIYTDNTLNDLKPYLTVTATYSDGTSRTVTEYILSGTLTEGISTITVSYSNKTTTFDVSVTERVTPTTVLYSLPSPTTFNGSSDYIDTGLKLLETDRSYTIVFDADEIDWNFVDGDTEAKRYVVYGVFPNVTGTNFIFIAYPGTQDVYYQAIVFSTKANYTIYSPISSSHNAHLRVALSHAAGSSTFYIKVYVDGRDATRSGDKSYAYSYQASNLNLLIGVDSLSSGRYFKGTINEFIVYNYAFSNAEVDNYVSQTVKTLQSITATFTQGSAVIYTDTSLNDLKPYLTVTANYSDSTTQTVTNYTLSGTLTEGISTITVSYEGKTTTFTVNVAKPVTIIAHYGLNDSNTTLVQGGARTHSDYNLSISTSGSRLVFGTTSGVRTYRNYETGSELNIYPIPIPSTATKVKISADATIQTQGAVLRKDIQTRSYDGTIYSAAIDSTGWQEGEVTVDITEGSEYLVITLQGYNTNQSKEAEISASDITSLSVDFM